MSIAFVFHSSEAIRGLLKLKLDLLSCKSKPQTRQKLWSPQGPAWQRHSADCKGRVGHPCSCAQRLRGFWPWHLGSYASLGGLEGNFVWLIGPFAPPPWQAISDDFAPPGRQEAWLHCCKVPSWLVCSPPQTNAVLSLKVEFQETVPQVGQLYVSKHFNWRQLKSN